MMEGMFPNFIPPELSLPAKYTQWRPEQLESVDDIVHSNQPVYLLDSPTGSGKSLTAVAAYKRRTVLDQVLDRMTGDLVPQSDSARIQERYRCIYLTRTIQLQSQVLGDFEGRMVKGRSNYQCNVNPKIKADECPGKCQLTGGSGGCQYHSEKFAALHAPLAVLNDAYYLSEVNGPGQFSGANMVVIDEIDSIESCLMDFIKFSVSQKQCEKYGLQPPFKMESLESWQVWATIADVQIRSHLNDLGRQLSLDIQRWSDFDIDINKQKIKAESFLNQLNLFRATVNDTWILDLEEKPKAGWTVTFKPVTVGPYCEKYLWRHGKRFLGMSGTILDPEILASDLGIQNYSYRRLDSQFPVENRPIYFKPVANLKYDKMTEELPKLLAEVASIIKQYPAENILVHTVSNKIRDYLVEMLPFQGIDPERVITHDTENRADKLVLFKKCRGLVMISPSFDRGIDLPDDECRVIIIAKMPYLNLNDKQVKARLAMPKGQSWYNLRAIQTVMQMSGRAIRNKDDFATTFILDKQFNSLLARTRHLLPKWWLEAVRRENG